MSIEDVVRRIVDENSSARSRWGQRLGRLTDSVARGDNDRLENILDDILWRGDDEDAGATGEVENVGGSVGHGPIAGGEPTTATDDSG